MVATTEPEVLARHNQEAGLTENAVAYWREAGRLAIRRWAMAEAVTHCAIALELLASLPQGPARDRMELELQVAHGTALRALKGAASPQVGQAYSRARELGQELDGDPLFAAALVGLFNFHQNRAEHDTARAIAEEMLCRATAQRDLAAASLWHRSLGTALLFLGKLDAAAKHLEQARGGYDRHGYVLPSLMSPTNVGVSSRIFLGWILQVTGHLERASTLDVEAASLACEIAQPFTSAQALHLSCILHQIRGEHAAVRKRSEALVAFATEQGFSYFTGTGTFFRGWAMAEQGMLEEGLVEMRRGLAAKRATGAEIKIPY